MCFIWALAIGYLKITTNCFVYIESVDKLFLDLSSPIYGEEEEWKEKVANPE